MYAFKNVYFHLILLISSQALRLRLRPGAPLPKSKRDTGIRLEEMALP